MCKNIAGPKKDKTNDGKLVIDTFSRIFYNKQKAIANYFVFTALLFDFKR